MKKDRKELSRGGRQDSFLIRGIRANLDDQDGEKKGIELL